MRIAIVTEYYRPTVGGVQEHVFHFAREARRRGHQVTVITSRVPGSRVPESGVVRLGRSLPVEANGSVGRVTVGADVGRRLKSLLTRDRFDLVHVHAPLSPVLPVLAARATKLPLVATHHTNFPKSAAFFALKRAWQGLVDRYDVHLAVSPACVRALAPYVRARFQVVPNGVDVAEWSRGRPLEALQVGGPVLLFIGRLEPRCGLDRLFAAWPYFAPGRDPQVVVVGDGPERARLEAQARSVGARARFFGTRHDDRADFFASAKVLVCPTTIASFGITLLEGMAAGLPIVASDIEGFRDVLTNGKEGLLVDSADPVLFAEAVARLLDDPFARAALGEEGRRTAARYDWSRIGAEVLEVYRSVGAAA